MSIFSSRFSNLAWEKLGQIGSLWQLLHFVEHAPPSWDEYWVVPKWVSWISLIPIAGLLALLMPLVAPLIFRAPDKAIPITWGMITGKVIDWTGRRCYMVDLGTVYRPESDTAIFVVAVGRNHKDRNEWVVEAECNKNNFIRGVGEEAFEPWPNRIMQEAIRMACSAPSLPSAMEHPLGNLTKEERKQFLYDPTFVAQHGPSKLASAVTYWGKQRLKDSRDSRK